MKLTGTYTFEAPHEVVWPALLDPDVLAKTMPGCRSLELVGESKYKGTLRIKVGPVQGQFEGLITLSNIQEPNGYHMVVDGRGAPGFVKGEGDLRLESQNGKTVLHYEGEAQVGGRLASVGQRLLDSSARALVRQSLDGLHEQIKYRAQAGNSEEPAPEVEAPSEIQFAVGVARNLLDEWVPAGQRPQLINAGLLTMATLFVLWLVSEWWMNRLANRVADILEKRR